MWHDFQANSQKMATGSSAQEPLQEEDASELQFPKGEHEINSSVNNIWLVILLKYSLNPSMWHLSEKIKIENFTTIHILVGGVLFLD